MSRKGHGRGHDRGRGHENGRESGRESGREGGRESGREGGREGGRENGREGGRENGREGVFQSHDEAEERYEYLYGHPPDISEEEGSKVVEKDSKKEADKLAHILQRLLVLSSNANQQPPNKEKKCNCCGSQTRKDLNAEEKNTALLACSSCFSVNYCSKECQKKDWKNGHRKLCPTLKDSKKA
ncbi:20884_t:CDS:2 [Entrophospora sp. SA101]|nr:20884_t:CDS:2 [Entrophospora sp. SA101]CAJ0906059.1 8016_t:CDS:2 [Entrophospora sp. SA101]